MNTPSFLDQLQIASPCDAAWEAMTGDHRVRHCAQCDKKVYNIAQLTRDEAMALFSNPEELPCIQLWKRADGTVLTADCPVGRRKLRARRSMALAASAFTALMAWTTLDLQAQTPLRGEAVAPTAGKPKPPKKPPVKMGKVAAPRPVQGLVACPVPPKADGK